MRTRSTSAAQAGPGRAGRRVLYRWVSAGFSHTCAIRTDQTLWCWGYNGQGQLGLGDFTSVNMPTIVP